MAVSYKFIHSSEVAIKEWHCGKRGEGGYFQVKLVSEACHLHFQNKFQSRICRKSRCEIF